MSIEVLLIPLGMMAYTAFKEAREGDVIRVERTLRITDRELFLRSLDAVGARYEIASTGDVEVSGSSGPVVVRSDAGALVARSRTGGQDLLELIDAIEAAAGRIRQADSVEEMRLRAAQLGLRIIGQQVSANGTVELVFEETEA